MFNRRKRSRGGVEEKAKERGARNAERGKECVRASDIEGWNGDSKVCANATRIRQEQGTGKSPESREGGTGKPAPHWSEGAFFRG